MTQEKNDSRLKSVGRKFGIKFGKNKQKNNSDYLVRSESFVLAYNPRPISRKPAENMISNADEDNNNKIYNRNKYRHGKKDKFVPASCILEEEQQPQLDQLSQREDLKIFT